MRRHVAKLRSSLSQQRILGGAIVLAVTQFGASVAGLFRDRTLTATFPGLDVVDVYITAFRPSDLLFQITIMAGLSTVLVPLLSRYKAHDDETETSDLLTSVMAIGSLAFGVISLAMAVAMPWIAGWLVDFEGDSLALYVDFARIALLTNFLFVFGNALGQYLITVQRYWIYGITPILYTAGTIGGTLWLTPVYGAYGPILGTLLGAIAYVVLRVGGAMMAGYRPRATLWHPDLRRMGLLMLPRMLALGALQAQLLLFDTVASGLDTGSVTINAYSRNFQSVLVGVVGIALAQSAFPLLSQAVARHEIGRFWIYMKKGTGLILLLTIPGAVALALAAPIAARLVNLEHVYDAFSACLLLYAVSIPFESMNHLLLRSFYAMHRTGVPAILSVLNGGLAIAATWMLAPTYGVYALALGYTAGQLAQMAGLALFLPRTVAGLREEALSAGSRSR